MPCVNYYDDSLPEFCSYNTERTPTAGVPLNLEPEFLCGCDCTDDCQVMFYGRTWTTVAHYRRQRSTVARRDLLWPIADDCGPLWVTEALL